MTRHTFRLDLQPSGKYYRSRMFLPLRHDDRPFRYSRQLIVVKTGHLGDLRLCGHEEHPKNTVRDIRVSLVTTERKQ